MSADICRECRFVELRGVHSDDKEWYCQMHHRKTGPKETCSRFDALHGRPEDKKQWSDEHESYSCNHN